MDILHLVDRLEEILDKSFSIPLTKSVILDQDSILGLIDQMRVTIPDEVKKSQQIIAQRDRYMAQAQEEANRTLALAREKSDVLVERDAIVQSAQGRADQIIAQAHAEADRIRAEADNYIVETLTKLELEMEKYLNQVRNGIHSLQNDQHNPG